MEWKDAKLVKVIIKSNIGGNLRLRVPNTLKLTAGVLKTAVGENKNPFYQITATPEPVISSKATLTVPELKKTWLYDIATQPGKTYSLIAL